MTVLKLGCVRTALMISRTESADIISNKYERNTKNKMRRKKKHPDDGENNQLADDQKGEVSGDDDAVQF